MRFDLREIFLVLNFALIIFYLCHIFINHGYDIDNHLKGLIFFSKLPVLMAGRCRNVHSRIGLDLRPTHRNGSGNPGNCGRRHSNQ